MPTNWRVYQEHTLVGRLERSELPGVFGKVARQLAADDAHIFHAGTTLAGDQVVTSGGRVLCVTALGVTVKIAQKRAYEVADSVTFEGMQMRRDIGWRAIKR